MEGKGTNYVVPGGEFSPIYFCGVGRGGIGEQNGSGNHDIH